MKSFVHNADISVASSEEPAEEDTEISDTEDVFGEDFIVESTRSLLNNTLCSLEV